MKLVGIGDLFIPHRHIREGFESLAKRGVCIETFDWQLSGFPELQEINHKVETGGSEAFDPPAVIYRSVAEADIIVTEFCPVPRKMIDACPRLKIIGILRAGTENVNVEYATSKGILVYNTPGRNADAVADFTVGMIICECRNIARGHHGLKQGEWLREYPNSGRIPDMRGKTIGIVGLGEIGKKVVKRLQGFDVKIIAHDPYVRTPPGGVELVALERLMAEADFVTIHARLTKETERVISRQMIGRMKPTSYFINTSRAGLVDEPALYEALEQRKIAGAALDVFEKEPPGKDYPLVTLENVTLTPHMAGGSNDAFFNSPGRLAAEINKLWAGERSPSLINGEIFEKALAGLALRGP
jgi:D-3-phosphoglycerate dehydrogenase / 2-oxoglutarate reductase